MSKPTIKELASIYDKACYGMDGHEKGLAAVRDACLRSPSPSSGVDARLRDALLGLLDCIRTDPMMDGSIRPRGLRSNAVEAIKAAHEALALSPAAR